LRPLSDRGVFITLEGPDGSGKSTQARLLAHALKRVGYRVLLTRQPGGSKASSPIRRLVLGSRKRLSPKAELFLFLADRAQHVSDTLKPALKQGYVVICDRYSDSTEAYQGAGRGLHGPELARLLRSAESGLKPELTLLLDVEAGKGLGRAKQAKRGHDRMEKAGLAFHRATRQGFLKIARREPRRVKVLKVAGRSIESVHAEVVGRALAVLP